MTTTIFPPASLASMTRCASWISSKPNTGLRQPDGDPAPQVARIRIERLTRSSCHGAAAAQYSLTAVVVQLAPGARVPSHHHAGFVFAYVLSGTVRSQLNDGPAVDYRIGQSWVEPPGTHHSLTANPSEIDTASLLAVFVASSGAKLTTIGP